MWKSLPTGWFKWLEPEKCNLDNYDDSSSGGCILEVDLKYPKELHELQSDYPLAPDKLKVKKHD